MQINALGCAGGIDQNARTTTFLLDNDTLIDAGTGVYDLPLQTQYGIDNVFITHAHFDHVAGLPFLCDSVARHRAERMQGPIKIYARPSVLEALHQHLFNNHIWPDFTRLPSVTSPAIALLPLEAGQSMELPHKRRIEALTAVHSVPSLGYAIIEDQHAWIFTGDTGRNSQLWERINRMQAEGIQVKWLVIEVTFTSDYQAFADLTGHLTAASLAEELQQIEHGNINIFLTHLKPSDTGGIMDELEALRAAASNKNCRVRIMPRGHIFRRTARMPPGSAA